MPSSLTDLRVWQEAMKFAVAVYRVTGGFPKHELHLKPATATSGSFGAEQHCRRQGAPIGSRIQEFSFACKRIKFEVQTRLMITQELQYIRPEEGKELLASSDAIGRCLNGLINSISEKAA
ncbi:MAG TPA: four helix bundle protein [Candidatus Binatia bacterium]|nr:four helix bundle protein [Candidatus Binatia bacterium]